jgi:hypothetical protein
MTTTKQARTSETIPLFTMALAILADGITTMIAVRLVGLHEANPIANVIGDHGPAALLLFRVALVAVLYFWATRRMTPEFGRAFRFAIAVVTGVTFAVALGNALVIIAEVVN